VEGKSGGLVFDGVNIEGEVDLRVDLPLMLVIEGHVKTGH
jgi:hypothetical protein